MKAKKDVLRREGRQELSNLVQCGEKAFGDRELNWVARKGINPKDFRK